MENYKIFRGIYEEEVSNLQELTFDFLKESFKKRRLVFNKYEKEELGLIKTDGIYTNLALLLSDQCMHSTKLALFKVEDEEVFLERKRFTGSLLEQFYRLSSYLDSYNSLVSESEGADRRGCPPEALKEVLLNALVHRDYSFSGPTLIHIYSDRLEVISLGGLVAGLSLEAVLLGASQPRNQKLTKILYRLGLIESLGTGLSRIQASYKGDGHKPIFQQAQGVFKVILPFLDKDDKKDYSLEIEKADKKYQPVLELFLIQEYIKRSDVEKALGVGSSYAIRILRELQDKDLIVKVGGGRKTSYRKN